MDCARRCIRQSDIGITCTKASSALQHLEGECFHLRITERQDIWRIRRLVRIACALLWALLWAWDYGGNTKAGTRSQKVSPSHNDLQMNGAQRTVGLFFT